MTSTRSGVCDICSNRWEGTSYLLTTTQVVSCPFHWQSYYSQHIPTWRAAGITSYEAFCHLGEIRLQKASDPTPWMVCSSCALHFDIDREQAKLDATKWFDSGGTYRPPGCGPAQASAINMGDSRWSPSGELTDQDSERQPLEEGDRVLGQPEAAIARSSGEKKRNDGTIQISRKKYYQCPGCGSIMTKNPTWLSAAGAGLGVQGGSTCSDCGVRSDLSKIVSGACDFECEDSLIEEMLRNASEVRRDGSQMAYVFRGVEVFGPASKRSGSDRGASTLSTYTREVDVGAAAPEHRAGSDNETAISSPGSDGCEAVVRAIDAGDIATVCSFLEGASEPSEDVLARVAVRTKLVDFACANYDARMRLLTVVAGHFATVFLHHGPSLVPLGEESTKRGNLRLLGEEIYARRGSGSTNRRWVPTAQVAPAALAGNRPKVTRAHSTATASNGKKRGAKRQRGMADRPGNGASRPTGSRSPENTPQRQDARRWWHFWR